MSYQRLYPQRINWEDEPSLATPINQVNLNKMDSALYGIDGRVVELDENKVGKNDTFNTSRNGVVPKPTQADITNEKVLRADGVWVEQSGGGGGGGGHTIVNNAGTSLQQRGKLRTVGGLNATDDSENNTTEITDVVEEVPWATWQSYPDEEAALRAHPNCVVTGAPDCDGTLEIENMHLAWENPNPTGNFIAQSIILNTDGDYDFIKVKLKIFYSDTNYVWRDFKKGENFYIETADLNNLRFARRGAVYTSATQIQFGSGVIRDSYNSSGQAADDARVCVPLEIYTYKKNLTAKIQAIARNVSTEASKCMLSDGVTNVEDALNFDGAWVEVNSKLSYKVRSGVVYAHVVVDVISSNWNSVGVLPSGVRPDKEFTTCIYYDGTYQSSIRVYTNGTIATISNYGGGFRGMVSFPLP